jgi:hypothetical protein
MHAQSWTYVLGSTGVENVRTTLAKTHPAGSQAGVWIGGAVITKGFAEHWLAWHDRKAKRAGRFRFWIAVGGAAVVVATVAALLTLTGTGKAAWTPSRGYTMMGATTDSGRAGSVQRLLAIRGVLQWAGAWIAREFELCSTAKANV